MVLALKFRFMLCLELTLVYDVKEEFIFALGYLIVPAEFFEKYFAIELPCHLLKIN